MTSTVLKIERFFPGDRMVPYLAAFVEMENINLARVTLLAQYYWFFCFKAPHHTPKAHERNPVWVRLTHERCTEWGCPVPAWAWDYVIRIANPHAGYRWPTVADERRAAAFLEAIRKSAIPDESRTHDIPWGEPPKLTRQERQRVKAEMADLQGENTSEETSRRVLIAVENHWIAWMQFLWDKSKRHPSRNNDTTPESIEPMPH
jgi:hypothetical protein